MNTVGGCFGKQVGSQSGASDMCLGTGDDSVVSLCLWDEGPAGP